MITTGEKSRRRAALVLGALLLAAWPAAGAIPTPSRVEKAIAETNKAAGRSDALKLEVVLGIGDRKGLAAGELISHPSGLARLELTATAGGLIERHLLRGSEHRVARNGEVVTAPRSFLPPLFLLQADTAATLEAGLLAFGIDGNRIGLATCGDFDCFVFGDPRIVVPRPAPAAPGGGEGGSEDPQAAAARAEILAEAVESLGDEGKYLAPAMSGRLADRTEAGAPSFGLDSQATTQQGPIARLWVDMKTYEVRRIDLMNGVEVELGPLAVFDRIRVPSYVLIREPGRDEARIDILGAKKVNAPPRAFDLEWLMAPVEVPPAAAAESGDASPPPSP